MSKNFALNRAFYSKENTDEWYTTYEDIKKEVEHYTEQFYNKAVYCNCDNPYTSNFSLYFLRNFNVLKLKELVCTCYLTSVNTLTLLLPDIVKGVKRIGNRGGGQNGLLLKVSADEIREIQRKHKEEVREEEWEGIREGIRESRELLTDEEICEILNSHAFLLQGNGDFSSQECVAFLQNCDICCTNPPFSLFRKWFALMSENKKKYLVITSINDLVFKHVFPAIMEQKAKVGYGFGQMKFRCPNKEKENNIEWKSIRNITWLTNLEITEEKEKLELDEKKCEKKWENKNIENIKGKYKKWEELNTFEKFDGEDVINIPRLERLKEIPIDYDGVMGVPITFFKYLEDDRFELVGIAHYGSNSKYDKFEPKINGKKIYIRLLIKRRWRGNEEESKEKIEEGKRGKRV